MDDYFHLNLKKFVAESSKDGKPVPESMPSGDAQDKVPTKEVQELALDEPVVIEDNSDPYNSTGRFNIKDVDW